MTRSLLVAAVLFALFVFCNGAPTKPSYSKENQADITMIEILNGGNITLSNGKQWLSRSRLAIRVDGTSSNQQLSNIDLFQQHIRYIIVANTYCDHNQLNAQYSDPFDLLSIARYVKDVSVNGRQTHQWSYTQGSFVTVDFFTSVSAPYDPVRVVFLQNGQGAQIDYKTFQNSISNYNVFTPPSICKQTEGSLLPRPRENFLHLYDEAIDYYHR